MSKPRPDGRTAQLWCPTPYKDHPRGGPQLHDYEATRESHVQDILATGELKVPEPCWEHVWRCRRCSATRRFGVEDRPMS